MFNLEDTKGDVMTSINELRCDLHLHTDSNVPL